MSSFDYTTLTPSQKRCLSFIEALGIYELRAVARAFGSNSPTTAKRSDHINYIMSKIINNEELPIQSIRKGRPHKELSNIDSILKDLSLLSGKNYASLPLSTKPDSGVAVIRFNQPTENEVKPTIRYPKQISGVVICKGDDKCLYDDRTNTLFLIKDDQLLINEYDYVTANLFYNKSKKAYEIERVETINYTLRDKYTPIGRYGDAVSPSKTIKTASGTEILLGSRYLLEINKFVDNKALINEFIDAMHNENCHTVALIPCVFPEDYANIADLNFDFVMHLNFDDSLSHFVEKLAMFVNHIENLRNQGRSVCIFVQDLVTISNILDAYYEDLKPTYLGHTEETISFVKQLLNLSKAYTTNCLTLIITQSVDVISPLALFISQSSKLLKVSCG